MRNAVIASAVLASAIVAFAHRADAKPRKTAEPVLTDLVMPAGDDARKAIAIGPSGEVYEPDGKGAWVRDRPIAMADAVVVVGRANGVVALADGAVYRLAENGWSALRLVQKGKAVMSSGARSVAAVGRQLFALDKIAGGEVAKLSMAPQSVLQIGAGAKAMTIQTERGLLRTEGPGAAWKPIARAPRRVDKLVDDRWALDGRGAIDLKTGTVTPWPAGFRLCAVTPGPKGTLMLVGTLRGAIEVAVIDGVKVTRETIDLEPDTNANGANAKGANAKDKKADAKDAKDANAKANAKDADAKADTKDAKDAKEAKDAKDANAKQDAKADAKDANDADAAGGLDAPAAPEMPRGPLANPVGVVTDKSGRVVVAFRDGRIAVRERGAWSVSVISEKLPSPRPGAPPATSP